MKRFIIVLLISLLMVSTCSAYSSRPEIDGSTVDQTGVTIQNDKVSQNTDGTINITGTVVNTTSTTYNSVFIVITFANKESVVISQGKYSLGTVPANSSNNFNIKGQLPTGASKYSLSLNQEQSQPTVTASNNSYQNAQMIAQFVIIAAQFTPMSYNQRDALGQIINVWTTVNNNMRFKLR